MRPQDANGPGELFGAEALTDLRSLKRRYAALLKQHTPEADPEGFQALRGHFDAAKAMLRADRVEAEQGEPEPPSDDDWVDELIERTTAENVGQTLDELRTRALEQGSTAAALTALAILEARAPTETLDLLAALADVPAHLDLVPGALGFLCRERGQLAVDPRTEPLVDRFAEHEGWSSLLSNWIAGLMAEGEVATAHAAFRAREPKLKAQEPRAWLLLLWSVLRQAAWDVPATQLQADLDALDDTRLPIEHEEYVILVRGLTGALAWGEAQRDPAVPRWLLQAVRAGAFQRRSVSLQVLRWVAERGSECDEALQDVRLRHPGLARLLADMESHVTGSREHVTSVVLEPDEPQPVRDEVKEVLDSLEKAGQGRNDSVLDDPDVQRAKRKELIAILMIFVGASPVLLLMGAGWLDQLEFLGDVSGTILGLLGWLPMDPVELGFWLALLGPTGVLFKVRAEKERKKAIYLAEDDSQPEPEELAVELRQHGLWVHELVLAVVTNPRRWPWLARHKNAPSERAVLGPRHVLRVLREAAADFEQSRAEPTDDSGEEDE